MALNQGISDVLSAMDTQCQQWLNGLELLLDAQLNKHVLPTGCEGVDNLLLGGLRQGQLTELTGPSPSGKTQVCLQAASHVAVKCCGTIIFLDTCNSFSSQRVADMVNQFLVSSFKEEYQRNFQRIMSKILCQSVFDIFTFLGMLHQLDCLLHTQALSEGERVHLLIIDSISSLIAPILGGRDSNGHSLMVSAGFLLKKLAHVHNLSILVTNHMAAGDGGFLKPALGESWKAIPHVRLLLSRFPQSDHVYSATVLKHSFLACGHTARFVISK